MTPITTFANMPSPDPSFLGAMSGQGMGGIPFPPPQHRPDLPPGFPVNPFLQLPGSPGHQAQAQAAQMAQHAQVLTSDNVLTSNNVTSYHKAALLSRNGLLPGASPSHEVMLEKYGHMLRQLQG